MGKTNEAYVYMTYVAILTRVNNCENKFSTYVLSKKPLTNKKVRQAAFRELMKEYEIEGMYGMHPHESHAITYASFKQMYAIPFYRQCVFIGDTLNNENYEQKN